MGKFQIHLETNVGMIYMVFCSHMYHGGLNLYHFDINQIIFGDPNYILLLEMFLFFK